MFIELTRPDGTKCLVNVNRVTAVVDGGGLRNPVTWIYGMAENGSFIAVTDTVDEIKAKIDAALGEPRLKAEGTE